MSKQKEVILSGVGGQGLIVCGTILGIAATLFDNKRATMFSEYGTETRGTFAKSDVIVSENDIHYQEAIAPELILCLAQPAYDRYSGTIPKGSILVYDSDQIAPNEDIPNEKGFSLLTMAGELGNTATLNMISLGVVTSYTNIVSPYAAREAIKHFWGSKSNKIVSLNYKAFDLGYNLNNKSQYY